MHILRIALRSLRRRPGFSLLAIVTIALGAGANAAVSAVAYGVLIKPLPFAEPDRIVAVWPGRFMSQVDLRYLREHVRGLSQVSGIAPGWTFSLTGAGDASKITVDRVSGNLFETLGAPPLLGRVIRADEDRPGAPKVLVLSHRYWRARFGGDSSMVGRTVKLDDQPHEIVGIFPSLSAGRGARPPRCVKARPPNRARRGGRAASWSPWKSRSRSCSPSAPA